MITLSNGTQLRNLEEQVQKNKEDIARHWTVDRVIAELGIKVYGRVNEQSQLADIPTDNLQYGDAYFVGTFEPYSLHVWTRPSEAIGEDTPYWLNVGPISLQGPAGSPGAQIKSIKVTEQGWLIMTLSDGTIVTAEGNLIGPAGSAGKDGKDGITPQFTFHPISNGTRVTVTTGSAVDSFYVYNGKDGGVGPQGKPGSFDIKGAIYDIALLPAESQGSPGDAYLVYNSDTGRFDLYVLITPDETTPSTFRWQNTGSLGSGTAVIVNNQAVAEFNADTKVDKLINESTHQYKIYAQTQGANGVTTGLTASASNTDSQVVLRSYGGGIELPQGAPIFDWMAVNKAYVDSKLSSSGGSSGGLSHTQRLINKPGGESSVYWVDYSQYIDGDINNDSYSFMIISYYDDNYDEYPYIETVTVPIALLRDKMWSGAYIDSWKFYADPGGLYIYPKNTTDSPCTMIIDLYK